MSDKITIGRVKNGFLIEFVDGNFEGRNQWSKEVIEFKNGDVTEGTERVIKWVENHFREE